MFLLTTEPSRYFWGFIKLLSETLSSFTGCLIVCLFAVKPAMCRAKESLLVNVNCHGSEASSSIALPWSSVRWNPSEAPAERRGRREKREGPRQHWIRRKEVMRECVCVCVSESDFPVPCDTVLWRLPLPAVWAVGYDCHSALEAPVWNLTSQYWNIETLILSSHGANWCPVIG